MPREIIQEVTGDTWFVKVGWGDGETVQVGVENDEGRSIFWLLFGQSPEARARMARSIDAAIQEQKASWTGDGPANIDGLAQAILNTLDTLGPHYQGLWSTLGRRGCNHLIRSIRNARDATWGRDD